MDLITFILVSCGTSFQNCNRFRPCLCSCNQKVCCNQRNSMVTTTVLHIFPQVLYWAGNQSNRHNFDPSLVPKKPWPIDMEKKQKFQIGPLVETIKWYKGEFTVLNSFLVFSLVNSPYVGQSDDHIGWDKLMPFVLIIPLHSRTNPWSSGEKILRLGGFEKLCFFWVSFNSFFFILLKISHNWLASMDGTNF